MLNPSEKYLREQLGEYEMPIDTDAVWENIAADLPQRKKKRRLLFWWWGGIAGLLLLGSVLFFISKINHPPIANLPSEAANKVTTEQPAEIEICPPFMSESRQKVITDSQLMTAADKEQTKRLASPSIFITKKQKTNNVEENGAKAMVKIPIIPKRETAIISPLSLPFQLTIADVTEFVDIKKQHSFPPRPPKRKRKRWSNVIDSYIGVGYSVQQLSAPTNDLTPLLQQRNATETSLETLQFGVDYRNIHRRGFFWHIGLQYQRITERFKFNQTRTQPLLTEQTDQVIVNPLNQQIGSRVVLTPAEQQIATQKRIYNHLHLIDLPVGIGYRYRVRGWRIELAGGLQLNANVSASGQIVRNAGGFTDLERVIRSGSAGIGVWADARFLRTFNRKWTLFIAPHLAQQLGRVSRNDYALRQRYGTIGVKLGIRMRL